MKKILILGFAFFDLIALNAQNNEKCELIVANILSDTSHVKELTKDWDRLIKENGGTGYGIQFYGEEKDIYKLVLVQHYPDRDYNANWFTIDVNTKEAFEESMADPMYNKNLEISKKAWKKLEKCNK